LLGVLADGTVSIKSADGSVNDFVIHGGFISISNNRVSILGESAN
jgi:F-type H+-transporting ATPase subunit epsilon